MEGLPVVTFDLLPVVSAVISVIGFFLPRFSIKYNELDPDRKQLAYVGIVAGVAVVAALLSYFGFVDVYAGEGWRYWIWTPLVDIVIALAIQAGVYTSFNKVADARIKKKSEF